ncbi:GerAB/ArcD/ProY family transporter [Paenibacillus sp. IHBB 10380]|uniref:GerAB/ArcD/ProY family transporter n=1 Tax=Paenibacillus sp. IHBB 10380 TaxID=1566358 RepID=UPI0005CFDF3D|nr:endospore germination permease [Paenibacillus sp. IHBB 10380]AJS58882.1 spore gernimation protein [Paenibacillus sp. IHBB 10380]
MPENVKISIRQFTVLVMLITIGDSILVLPSIAAFEAKQDAWISSLIGLAVGLLVVYIFSMVGKLYPHLTLVQSIQEIFGKWFGTFVSLMFLFYTFLSVVAHTRETGDFVTSVMMQETPTQAIQILFVCIVIMAVRLGLEVIGRTGEIFLPWIIFFFLILVILLSPQAEFEKLQPILENGIKPVFHGSLSCIAFPFMELVVFLMIFPYVNQPQQIRKGFLQGALLGGIVLIIIITVSILVLGADHTARSMYPTYSLARRVTVGRFFERVEAILALMWTLTIFMKVSLFFYTFNLGLAQLLKLKEYRMLTLPVGLLLIVLTPVISPSITYYNKVLSKYWPYFDLTFALLLPLLLLVVYFIRAKFKRSTT